MSTILIAALSFGVVLGQGRGGVAKVEIAPRTAETGQQISITVSGTNPCGAVHLITDDGMAVTHPITALPSTHAHTYRKPGKYTIVAQGMGNCDGEAQATVEVTGKPLDPDPPPAPASRITNFQMKPVPGRTGEAVTFAVQGQGACEVSLEFGDGNSRRLRGELPHQATHTYAVAGRYTVIARPAAPCEGRFTETLEVVDSRPAGQLARLMISPAPAATGQPVTIRVEGSGRCAYHVDFGDGNGEPRDADLPDSLTRYYHRPGMYTVTATAKGPCRGSDRVTFEVRGAGPSAGGVAGIDVFPARPAADTQVTFTVRGSGECRLTVDFGDGSRRTYVGTLPMRVPHVYQSAGRRVVEVTGDQPCGGSARIQVDVGTR
jgi:hypothetical protein